VLIHQADSALYRAKAAGRDRIVLVEPLDTPSATGTATPSASSNEG
jgi:hypothetical protein